MGHGYVLKTKTGKFAVVYFPLDVNHMHLTKTVCYDLGNNKKKIGANVNS
jgi:hypothetical protein